MEIDFLGLNSNTCKISQDSSKDSCPDHTWNGGVETSLSLSTGCSFYSQTKNQVNSQILGLGHYSSRTGQAGVVLALGPLLRSSIYPSTRDKSKTVSEPSSQRMLYFGDNPAAYASAIGLSSNAKICSTGYTPTVAMARKATLARFLEKRVHRWNQARTRHLMGKASSRQNI